ncbi:MAG: hypothetical protein EXS16_04510 [Gemmataceae bacterium]|nr:hypothetical protein [Gemmataceae bacterium]
MNIEHLRAFIWLRWRLFVNQLTRGSTANLIVFGILGVLAIPSIVSLFIGAFVIGYVAMPQADPTVHLLVWDGLALGFLFMWSIGILQELQRSEGMSLSKFLHLPVSVAGVFVLNYVSTLLSLSLAIFVPAMTGLVMGMTLSMDSMYLVALFPILAFFFAVTALTYHFQGWLASMMVNPRRRRTVIVIVTLVFVFFAQAPNLINVIQPWRGALEDFGEKLAKDQKDLDAEFGAGKVTAIQHTEKVQESIRKRTSESKGQGKKLWSQVEEVAWVANLAVPIGWMPLGAAWCAEGNPLPAILATLVLTGIGAASLWRSYCTTLRMYLGEFTAGDSVSNPPPTKSVAPLDPADKVTLIEKQIPGLSEYAAVVALVTFRSIIRAPETKMLLLSPIIMLGIFGTMMFRGPMYMPAMVRPLVCVGVMAIALLTAWQLVANQFALDRAAFRAYVLCPAPRREILLGKNLAVAPIVAVLALPMVALAQIAFPMRIDHLAAFLFQFVSMLAIFAMVANVCSILAPIPMAQGTLKPASTHFLPTVIQLGLFMLHAGFQSVVLLPIGIEVLLAHFASIEGWPIALPLSIAECGVLVLIYRWTLGWQGDWLMTREQRILEEVTAKTQ